VEYDGKELTYSELNRRANQLAHYLRETEGVGPETLVGISMERSLEMVVGLLGILKAGAAYVPLDPAYPKERLAFMVEDAQVGVLLTRDGMVDRLPEAEYKQGRIKTVTHGLGRRRNCASERCESNWYGSRQ
jgi:non-ribosomal peptide synthetase component F